MPRLNRGMEILGDKELADTLKGLADQGPFITSSALNTTAFAAQKEVRNRLPQWVHLTRPFLQQSVVVDKATKQAPEAWVGFLKRAPLVMLMEEGGTRRPANGGGLAIPVDAKRGKSGAIPASQRPRALVTNKNVFKSLIDGFYGLWKQTKRLPLTLLYVFKRSAEYRKKHFHFYSTVEEVAKRDLETNFKTAMEYAVKTAKRK